MRRDAWGDRFTAVREVREGSPVARDRTMRASAWACTVALTAVRVAYHATYHCACHQHRDRTEAGRAGFGKRHGERVKDYWSSDDMRRQRGEAEQ
jgi:hypothetical protein